MSGLLSNVTHMSIWIVAIPAILPALLMIAAHYFPWSATPLGKLSENQARAYGVSCIIATVMVAVAIGEAMRVSLDAWQTIGLAWLAALSAGTATIWVWGLDTKIRLQQDITEEKHRSELLRSYAEERDIQ